MTKIFKRSAALMAIFIAIVMCFTVVAPLAACGGPTLDPLQIEELNKATAEINVGDTLTLKARTNRDPEEDEVIVWSSDKTAVATVDDNGKVKGVSEGEATITATYNETSASCKVTVTLRREITLDKTTATLDCDIAEQLTLTATASKGGEVDNAATITWKSSDDKVATVVNGVVTAKGQGNAVITATYEGVAASCNVQVVSYNAPYTVERGATNATIANTPGIWFYFLKTSDGVAAYEGENITRSVENGKEKIDAEFAKIEILEGQELNNMQFYLRYMPNFALETPYVVSFNFVANVDGRVEIGQNTRVDFTANEEVEVSAQMTVTQGMPLNIKLFMVGENVKFTLTGITFTEVTGQPEPNPDPNPNPNPNPDPEPQPTVEYEDVAGQYSVMAAESWYKFGTKGNTSDGAWPDQVQDGKVVITSDTPARMDLFKVDATPTNGSDGDWVNLVDKTENFTNEGKPGTGFYGYEYMYDMTVATTGEFSLVLFGTSATPAIFNGTTHRAVYLFFTDGKVELKQSGTGKDAVQASATYNGTVTGITSLRLSVTRVKDTDIVLKVYVNGTKLVMSGSPTTGKISAAGDYVDRIVTATNGYGQRFGIVPAEGNTFTISAANVQRSKTTVAAPELVELTTETAKLVLEGDKVYLVIEGSYTGPDAAAKAEVAATLIDLQQMNLWGYPVSGQAKSEAKDGKFSIYLDITSLEVNDAENYYFGHFGSGNLDSCGLTTDTAALTVTANGKVYTLGRNGNDLTDAWKRGLITINVTAA